MKYKFFFGLLLVIHHFAAHAQAPIFGAGIAYTNGAPAYTPKANASQVAIDTVTFEWYEYETPGGWRNSGYRIQTISGCSAPAYTPGKAQSLLVINNCDSMYYYRSGAWRHINNGGSVIEPNTQIVYGTGTGVDSDTAFVYNKDSIRVGLGINEPDYRIHLKGEQNYTSQYNEFIYSCFNLQACPNATYTLHHWAFDTGCPCLFSATPGTGYDTVTYDISGLNVVGAWKISIDVSTSMEFRVLVDNTEVATNTTLINHTFTGSESNISVIVDYSTASYIEMYGISIYRTVPEVQAKEVISVFNKSLGIEYQQFGLVLNGSNMSLSRTLKKATGAFNFAAGQAAGVNITSGQNNMIFGGYAGANINSGGYNTLIGNIAGNSLKFGSYNTFLGYGAGFGAISSNQICIGDNTAQRANNSSPYAIFIGSGAARYLPAASSSIAIGTNALQGFNNSVTGSYHNNVAIGTSAGRLIRGGSVNNILIGEGSGENLNGGFSNTLIGGSAGRAITGGARNVYIGSGAGWDVTNGSDNIGIGRDAGRKNTTGNNNLAFGSYALANGTSGDNTTAIGNYAGYNNTASGCVFLGNSSGYNNTTNDLLYIDNSNNVEPLIAGDFSLNRVGINTSHSALTATLQTKGRYGYDQFRMVTSYTPTATGDTNGNIGDVAWDDNYVYLKTSAGWKRTALSTF